MNQYCLKKINIENLISQIYQTGYIKFIIDSNYSDYVVSTNSLSEFLTESESLIYSTKKYKYCISSNNQIKDIKNIYELLETITCNYTLSIKVKRKIQVDLQPEKKETKKKSSSVVNDLIKSSEKNIKSIKCYSLEIIIESSNPNIYQMFKTLSHEIQISKKWFWQSKKITMDYKTVLKFLSLEKYVDKVKSQHEQEEYSELYQGDVDDRLDHLIHLYSESKQIQE